MNQRRRRPRIEGHVLNKFEALVINNPLWGASQVYSALRDDEELRGKTIPSIRTIQERMKDFADPSGQWFSTSSGPDEAALVLPVLATVVQRTQGQKNFLTNNEAKWITHVRTVAADLSDDLWYAFLLARAYAALDHLNESPAQLDAFVAFAPWRSVENARAYQEAFQKGWVPAVFPFFWTLVMVETFKRANKEGINGTK